VLGMVERRMHEGNNESKPADVLLGAPFFACSGSPSQPCSALHSTVRRREGFGDRAVVPEVESLESRVRYGEQ
jgi:hypothetical protein